MKILQVITSLRMGGAEKLVADMIPLLMEQGHQVDVVLFKRSDSELRWNLQRIGVRIYEFSEGDKVYNPLYILKLIPLLKEYDVVHTHNTACQLFTAIASLFSKGKLVTTEHSTSTRRRAWKWYRIVDKWMYAQYQAVVCISDKAKENLSRYLGTENHILTIYNGINCEAFKTAKVDSTLSNGKIVVTMVAGFRYQKDQDTLIKAFQYLPRDKFELWLVGDGARRTTLETLVAELGLQASVRFWGIRGDVPVLLKSSDIIVMSSHFEGLSLSSIEGMCVGKPFVASDVDGLHEITEGAGILFPHGDAKALAKIFMDLMTDKVYYEQVASLCMRRALQYDIHKTVKQYLEVYKSLLNSTIYE